METRCPSASPKTSYGSKSHEKCFQRLVSRSGSPINSSPHIDSFQLLYKETLKTTFSAPPLASLLSSALHVEVISNFPYFEVFQIQGRFIFIQISSKFAKQYNLAPLVVQIFLLVSIPISNHISCNLAPRALKKIFYVSPFLVRPLQRAYLLIVGILKIWVLISNRISSTFSKKY